MVISAGQQMAEQANSNTNKQIFGAIIINVKTKGAKGDNSTDDTAAILAALAAASNHGGGLVYAPQGIYRVSQQITIPKGVTLQGMGNKSAPQWVDGTGWDTTYYGTVFAITQGAGGSSITNAAFLMSSYSKIVGCVFWYPNQSGSTATPNLYPPTIAHVNGDSEESNSSVIITDLICCVFVNSWICGDFTRQHEQLNITDVLFFSWFKGFRIDKSSDVDRIVDVHGNPNIMYRGSYPTNNAYEYGLANAGLGFEIGSADQIYFTRCFVFGYNRGFIAKTISATSTNGLYLVECGFEGSNKPFTCINTVRRLNISVMMLGTVDRSSASQSFVMQLDADAAIDECVISGVTSFTSATNAFYFENVKHLTMNGCNAYGSNHFDTGVEEPALFLKACEGVTIRDCHFVVYGSNANAVGVRIQTTNGISMNDIFLSGQTKVTQDMYFTSCTHGRVNRLWIKDSLGTGTGQTLCTDVTFVDTITY